MFFCEIYQMHSNSCQIQNLLTLLSLAEGGGGVVAAAHSQKSALWTVRASETEWSPKEEKEPVLALEGHKKAVSTQTFTEGFSRRKRSSRRAIAYS